MSDRRSKTLPDLTDGWPDEAGNEELSSLGQELFADRPELSQIALDRIQVRMRREMNRPWWSRRWRTVAFSLVALIAIGTGAHQLIHCSKTHSGRPADAPTVQDRYDVTLPPTSPKAPDKPLIDVERDKELFGKDAKEPRR
jgi:hypothetical protein